MPPELVRYLIAIWCFPGMLFLGGGETGGGCCILMEDSGDVLMEDAGCIEPEDC